MNKSTKSDQVSRLVGIAILVGFAVLCCVGNASFAYLASRLHQATRWQLYCGFIGLIRAQGCTLSIWLVLGDENLRSARLICQFGDHHSGQQLGIWQRVDASIPTRSFSNQPEWKTVYILGFIPVIALGLLDSVAGDAILFFETIGASVEPACTKTGQDHRIVFPSASC